MTEDDPIMTRIQEGVALRVNGDHAGALERFSLLWREIGERGDPLHRCVLAHHMADVQDDPAVELDWDLRALRAADDLTDERARRFHDVLVVRGFYPSLHLNLGECYRKLGDLDSARDQLELGRAKVDALADDDYGRMLRGGLDGLADRLSNGS